MRIITVFNLKGGTAKSTTCVSLGSAWQSAGLKTLIVDLDPQGSASKHLGCRSDGESFRDAMVDNTPLEATIVSTDCGVDLIPAGEWLVDIDAATQGKPLRELRLARLIDPLRQKYSKIILDCPPSPGLLNTSALLACDAVIIPVEAQGAAVDGLFQATSFLDEVDLARDQPMHRLGIIVSKFDARTTLSREVERALRDSFGDLVCTTVVHRNVRVAEAYMHGSPVQHVSPGSRGAEDFNALAAELLNRMTS